jgi:hypothetical protein
MRLLRRHHPVTLPPPRKDRKRICHSEDPDEIGGRENLTRYLLINEGINIQSSVGGLLLFVSKEMR